MIDETIFPKLEEHDTDNEIYYYGFYEDHLIGLERDSHKDDWSYLVSKNDAGVFEVVAAGRWDRSSNEQIGSVILHALKASNLWPQKSKDSS